MSTTASLSLPAVGSEAPLFTLPATGGGDVSLANYRGKQNVLLAFFPLAFTSTCTAEMCEFNEEYARYDSADTAVLPISVDSVPSLNAFKAQEGLRLNLLSDFRREVARAYGVLKEPQFFAARAYVLIDRSGIIRWTHLEPELGMKRATEELLQAIDSLR